MIKDEKNMKKVRLTLQRGAMAVVTCVLLSLMSCATSGMTREEKAAERACVAQAVEDSVMNMTFTVEVNYVNPQRMPSRMLNYGYSVKVDGDYLDSYLPFFGRVYRAEFGEQTGLHFKERIAERKVVKAKGDCYAVELVVRRRLEILIYRFDVFSNGKVSLMVTSDNRDSMLFSGELAL